MSSAKRVLAGCVGLPALLVASCAAKMVVDAKMYELPGEVMRSPEKPTRRLETADQVALALDTYVQPRFEILRDKNFGAIRITYPRHAGVNQLKVETPLEKRIVADVNASGRDYAIYLLHCAPTPPSQGYTPQPTLDLLYYNRDPAQDDSHYLTGARQREGALEFDQIEQRAIAARADLMRGREQWATVGEWRVLMRPVGANSRACLGCHTDARHGDTLGVMVYAVRLAKQPAG
jgi:hypothetical protein